MRSRTASICLLCALSAPPTAFAADAATGGAVAPPQPARLRQVAPVPATPLPAAPATSVPAPARAAPTVAPAPIAAEPAPLAASPEAAVRTAATVAPPKPVSTAAPRAPIELASVVRDSPPLRSPSAMAVKGADAGGADVVEVPVPRPEPVAPAPAVVARLPHTGFDIGLMISAGLALLAAGLMIAAVTEPPTPARGLGRL